ncbi:DUF1684 domain-containing protein [Deinococcus humi]|uniref:DUF1684 domain-containing protein n=1 Tax=Deinococcus humi TaxID=662880 RepID=A0A7W8JVZ1_9DEIO|nr:DUF1684 domain-containing protein [Deinococcus humi]MBB5364267.1 hypothetical protein [Deinococcus humi]GGO35363.1 hypothetical protein GCM10008949_37680 [Deinococcus humi]
MSSDASKAWLDLLDWRREASALYARVRDELPRDPGAAHQHWQTGRNALFKHHAQSPLDAAARASFTQLPCWPYEPALAFTARVDVAVPQERLTVASSTGQAMPLVRFGSVVLPIGTLDVYWIDVYGGGVFLPFRDATSGGQSYGGGRYLLDTAKSADLGRTASGELVLDFNFAFHPSCFYDPRWSCPLAPPQNVLSGPVRAGERAF